jgi:hypothetical protein
MKKTLFSILASTFIGGSMLAQTFGFFPTNNATTGTRGPNPGDKAQINCSNYAASDFAGAIPNGAQIVFVGWYLQGSGTATTVTSGNLQVYLENTTDAIYAKTSNTWTAVTAPMTSVYNSTIAIPNSTTTLPYGVNITPFNYTGNGLYVSFAYTNAGILGATTTHSYIAYSAPGTATTTPMSRTAASTTSTVLPVSVGATASVFKACIVLGYQMVGQEPGITYVTINGSNQLVNTGNVPVTIGLRNVGSVNVTAASYNIVANNGVASQTITATPAINSSTTTVLTATLATPTLVGLNNYTFTLNSSSDTYTVDNIGYGNRFFFPTKSVFMEDFNDTAKWKNIVGTATLNAAAMPTGYSVVNNDAGGTVGPFLIGSSSVIPYFEGNQSLFDNYATANGFIIDDWLITPQITGYCSANHDTLNFYLKGTGAFADSVEVLLSPTGGNLVTDFTVSMAYLLAPGTAWTKFTYDLNSLLPAGTTNYRVAFRYKMGNGGASGANSDNFALDCAHITRTNAVITSNAGPNQTVATTLVNLTGTSTGTITSSTWTQVSGPAATITSSTSLNTPVTLTGGSGNYCFQLTVTDGCNTATSTVCVNASITTGITTSDIELISISPNPAKDVVYLNASSIKGTEISISIVSVDGRIVYSTTTVAEEKMLINLQNLNTGIYFMNVNGKEFKQLTKLIKE